MNVVGLTGGIGCGKSTVSAMFAAHGVPIVDADQLARDVVAPGTDGLNQIIETFGRDIVDADGALDRQALGDVVFADEAARHKLNAITHPLIATAGARAIAELARDNPDYIVYEAALLVENNAYTMFSALIVVACKRQTQVARILARDGLDVSQANARIDAQLPLADKVAVADFVIDNDGSTDELRVRVAQVHQGLLERFAR